VHEERPGIPLRIAAMVYALPLGACVADIGTDHGLLLVDAVRRRGSPHAIGIDVRREPLEVARRGLERLDQDTRGRIELRRGDGLAPLAPAEVDAIVVAGMGGDRIASILAADAGRAARGCVLVLQPTTHWPRLRAWLDAHGHATTSESFVHDRGRDHLVIVARAPS
jgi:tRNA (adenine22-N1)-methyltransferase